jgi:hypothetical protein
MMAVKNTSVTRRTVRMLSATLVAARDATPPAIDILPHARPAGEPQQDTQNGGGQVTLPTPIDRPREESTMPARAIAVTPSIAPESADSLGDITVGVTFNLTDPYGMIELTTSPDLDGEALLEALDALLKHVTIYRRGYRVAMLVDRDTRNEVRR